MFAFRVWHVNNKLFSKDHGNVAPIWTEIKVYYSDKKTKYVYRIEHGHKINGIESIHSGCHPPYSVHTERYLSICRKYLPAMPHALV